MDKVLYIFADHTCGVRPILSPRVDRSGLYARIFATHQTFIGRRRDFGGILIVRQEIRRTFVHSQALKFIQPL